MPSLRHSVLIRAPAAAVRLALLDGPSLSRILGHACAATPEVGGEFSMWDGLISGHNARVTDDEVVQVWMYALPHWPEGVQSNVLLRFIAEGEATRVALSHSSIPSGCVQAVEEHWRDHVWPGLKALLEKPERQEVGFRRWLARAR